jgi:hypothetical protein
VVHRWDRGPDDAVVAGREGAVIAIVVALTLSLSPSTTKPRRPRLPPPPAWVAPDEEKVDARVRAAWRAGINERLVDVTDAFVGAPYLLSPLGEGEGRQPDPDPRLRFDAFDCTTFVETALALSLGHDLDDARAILDRIRYRGENVAFAERRHFPEAEWLPGLRQAGLLEDVTRQVGGNDVTTEKKTLDGALWRRARGRHLPELPPERVPHGTFALDVWALGAAARDHAKIPPGTVLSVVRVDFRNVPVRVSHQGLVVQKNGRLVLRHAADRLHHHVVDEPLDRFFARLGRYSRWPVTGVHLARVAPTADWRARLGVADATTTSPPTTDPAALPAPSSAPSSGD